MLMCGCDTDGWPAVFREKFQVARKAHKCCECGGDINPGDEYHYVFGVWEGGPSTYKTCNECAGLWESLQALGFCQIFEGLNEAYREFLNEYCHGKPVPENHITKRWFNHG